jgi:hypothetical protein
MKKEPCPCNGGKGPKTVARKRSDQVDRLYTSAASKKGAAPVFISEQVKAIFKIEDYPGVVNDLGYHVEIAAMVDESAKTISVRKGKRLSYEGATCARPKKIGTKK